MTHLTTTTAEGMHGKFPFLKKTPLHLIKTLQEAVDDKGRCILHMNSVEYRYLSNCLITREIKRLSREIKREPSSVGFIESPKSASCTKRSVKDL